MGPRMKVVHIITLYEKPARGIKNAQDRPGSSGRQGQACPLAVVQCDHLPKVLDSTHVLAIPGDSIHVGHTMKELGRRPDHDLGHENLKFDGRKAQMCQGEGGGQTRGSVTEKLGM